MKIAQHLSKRELEHSNTAIQRGLGNIIPEGHYRNMFLLAAVFEVVRGILKHRPLRISSGYRGPVLNKAVGGAKSSDHCYTAAIDIVPRNMSTEMAMRLLVQKLPKTLYRIMIIERHGSSRWIHISIPSSRRPGTGKLLRYTNGTYTKYKGFMK